MKYYAIKVGRKTGIFTTWEETKSYVIGFKGAIFKSFTNYEDACDYMRTPIIVPKKPSSTRSTTKSKRGEIARYWSYAARRERMNKDRDRYKYSIQDRTFDYYSDRSQKRKK
jgi:ribonuclease HI